jgi:transposase
VCVFLRDLLRHLRGPVIAILDNSTTHHGEPLAELQRQHPRLHIEHFPSYAPELNPDEGVWSQAKRDLANGCPHDVQELMDDLTRSIENIRKSPAKLRGCILQSELPLFCADNCIIYAVIYNGTTLEQSTADRHDMLLAVPVATNPPAMAGTWGGITFLYTPGPPVLARAGRFRLSFNANGNVNSTSWTYHESDLDNRAPHDVSSTRTWSVDGTGIDTYTSAQGNKRIAVSADGNTGTLTLPSMQEMLRR